MYFELFFVLHLKMLKTIVNWILKISDQNKMKHQQESIKLVKDFALPEGFA